MRDIKELVNSMKEELSAMRRGFHQYPELSNQETRTMEKICQYLESWGIAYETGAGKTGVVAIVTGKLPGRTVGIRADMDALPIEEQRQSCYRSKNPGVMHACGHDAHVTVALGAAKIFQEIRDDLKGSVKFFFQPAEETTGGAERMIEEGCLENPHVDYVLGLHVNSGYEAGQIGVRYGRMMAASDEFTITLEGKASHGAHPDLGNDTVVAAAAVVNGLQTLVSRNVSPVNPAVCTIGKLSGGAAGNVVCERLQMDGILRTLDPETRTFLRNRLTDMVEHTAEAYGSRGSVVFHSSYGALINTDQVVDTVKKAAEEVLGEECIFVESEPDMGTEDFSYFAAARPSCFWHLGCANREKGICADIHNGMFDIDETCLGIGVEIQVISAIKLLEM